MSKFANLSARVSSRRIALVECSYHSPTGISQKQLLSDPQVSLQLGLVGKLPTKRLTVVTTQPESAGRLD